MKRIAVVCFENQTNNQSQLILCSFVLLLQVTGGNKGIGFAIVKSLCQKFDGIVYLTARDVKRGQTAAEKLEKEGFKPIFHQLDTTDTKSIETFRDHLQATHGRLDVLINNAAIAFKVFFY